MYKRICITCKYLWFVWQRSIVAQSLKSLWGQREGAFEEGTCACFLASRRVPHIYMCIYMYKRICITCKYLWRVWQCSIVAQSLKNLWGQRESAFEEGTCACFLATLGQRVTHFVRRQGECEVLLEVHQPIEDAPNSGKARPAVSTIEHRGVVHGEKKAIQVNLGQSAKQVVERGSM